jgi:zinc protease
MTMSLSIIMAQKPDKESSIPVDPLVKVGKLKNGLTYYIRKNDKPENKVEFRLVVNAGSLLENEQQQGLAHFTEHMAFNGSENFQKNELIDYLQSAGVKFGADLNAYTSFDETVYILPIPTEDPAVLSKGMLVLEDWAAGLKMSDEEIDKERGVVLEEYRLGQGANQRMRDEYFPVLFKDSRYSERLPIGKKEVLENFDYSVLKSFYQDWYRPNLMAVIAVGDLDIAEMEKEITQRFGKLKNPKNPKKREIYPVPNHEEVRVSISTDKEANFNQVQIIYKHESLETTTLSDLRRELTYQLYNGMLGSRLNELSQAPEPPFLFANTSYSQLVRSKSAYSSFALAGENGIGKATKVIAEENKRVKEHGFTQAEFERYKKSFLNSYEKQLKEADKTESNRFASEYIRHFLSNSPIPGIKFEYEFYKKAIESVTLEELNQLAEKWITDDNLTIIVTGPEKESNTMPTESEILAIFEEVKQSPIEPYTEEELAESFMTSIPEAGSVVESIEIADLGVTELLLSNGVKVVLKPTEFKNDEIRMRSFSFGGHNQYEMKDYYSASNASSLVNEAGFAGFSSTDISKMLSGKTASVSPFIGGVSEGMNGSASPKDFETMLQMTYLYFTDPRFDEEAFNSFISKNQMLYANLLSSPQNYYIDKFSRVLSQDNPRGGGFPRSEDLNKVDFKRAFEIYKERFADASDFTFVFVGNFKVEEIKPLLATYLGSLPNLNRNESWTDLGIEAPKGVVKEEILKGSDPKSYATIYYHGKKEYDALQDYRLSSLGEVVTNKLIDVLREEKSGVYGVGANAGMIRLPNEKYYFRIAFPCGPENVEDLVATTHDILKDIKANGITEEDLNKVKQAQLKGLSEDLKQNSYWINRLYSFYYYGDDLSKFMNAEQRIEDLTKEDLKVVANEFINEDQYVEAILLPEDAD